jgi:phosphoribosylglycinamide formyltransferase 1
MTAVTKQIKLGILGSTNGTDLQAIINAIAEERLNASVEVVISNRSKAYILERAQNHNIPAVFIPDKGKQRKEFDAEMTAILQEKKVDLVLLIGFMRILSPEFCRD